MHAMVSKHTRNGEIELLRFIFSMGIVYFHFTKNITGCPEMIKGTSFENFSWTFFAHGNMGVEFFFLCSGFMMAMSVSRQIQKEGSVPSRPGTESLRFLLKKCKGFWLEHSIAFVLILTAICIFNEAGVLEKIRYIFSSLPSYFLVQMSGLQIVNPNGVEWYLSAMLISMFVIYPFLRRHYDFFARYIAPTAAILILGYLILKTGSLANVSAEMMLGRKALFRGFAEICAGIFTYEVAQQLKIWLKGFNQKRLRVLLEAVSLISFAFIMVFIVSNLGNMYQFYIVFFGALLLICADLKNCYERKWINSPFILFLGKLSLPIYLCQNIAFEAIKSRYLSYLPPAEKAVILTCVTLALALICMFLANAIRKDLAGPKAAAA